MDIKFRVIDVDLKQHSIIVRYYTDNITEDDLATSFILNSDNKYVIDRKEDGSPKQCQTDYNINIWKTEPPPTENDILEIARNSAPFDWFKLKSDILNPNVDTSLSSINSLIGKEFIVKEPEKDIDYFSEEQIEEMIRSVTVKSNE